VADQTNVVETIARQLVEQCRRDLEAAALALAGARAILDGSRWLLTRWDERRRADAVTGGLRLPAFDDARAGMFLSVPPPEPHHRRRKRRAS
jgi:hypothetical protein